MRSRSIEARARLTAKLLPALLFVSLVTASAGRAQCISIGDSCDDGNPCTIDDRCIGVCGGDICVGDECAGMLDCGDGNACTADSCVPGVGCEHAPISCDDSNACTADECDFVAGCENVQISCADDDACTADSCDAEAGCTTEPITCDDNNACTEDGCDPLTGCTTRPIRCDDNNACTEDGCDAALGCQNATVPCDDNNACTDDTCDPQTGCASQPIACNDNDACTTDGCDPLTGCTTELVTCDDNNPCTTDGCDPLTGCTAEPVVCDDDNACTVDLCLSQTGCLHGPLSCNDNDACTIDGCNESTGCTHQDVVCSDGNACTNEVCDPGTGCLPPAPLVGRLCDDDDPCTLVDACDAGGGCRGTPMQCPDDACSRGRVCGDGECQGGTGIDCADGVPCTLDTCDLAQGGCQHVPTTALCDDGDPCTAKSCDRDDGCEKSPLTGPACEDGDACTSGDVCQAGQCVSGERRQCADTPCFTERVCLTGECVGGSPVVCNDRLNCTLDSCDSERGCVFTPSDDLCFDAGPCSAGVCDPISGCGQQPRTGPTCDDGDGCTSDDRCEAGTCRGSPVTCTADAFECTNEACIDGGCRQIPSDTRCDAGICELGACRPGDAGADRRGCVAVPVEEGERCTDDGFACTDDVCTGRQCLHVPIDSRCGVSEECTRTVCSPEQQTRDGAGCVVAPLEQVSIALCAEDGDPCTDDQCSDSRCVHQPVPEVVTCQPVLGAFRRALGLASLTRGLMVDVEGMSVPSGTGGGSVAALTERLDTVETALVSVSSALSGKITAEERPNLPRTSLPETPAQQRARIAFVQVRKTPKQVQNFLQLVAEARARSALRREHARALRRRGRLLLRGTKTLKGELKRIQRVSKSFTR